MTDILIFEDSYERIREELANRDVRVICWHGDGRMSLDGATVSTSQIAPQVGWISFDVFTAKKMAPYAEALASFDTMQWVQSAMAGLDTPPYQTLAKKGVRLSKSWAQSIPIAEYVLAHALSHFQDLPARAAAQVAHEWRYLPFRELYAKRWLIIGFGHIGRRVAMRARAFECHVTALRSSLTPDPAANAQITRAELLDTLSQVDVVVLACPQTPETTGMVNADFIGSMKPGALLVNVARGGLIDDEALLEGLAAGRPGAAVLDVFHEEPLPASSAYWSHDKVTVTAHMSNAGEGTQARGCEQFLQNLDAYLAREQPTDEVSPASLLANKA
ncbi:MAG: phosphoglycerate dehydrogenase-like enzyme [Gammaproteobacteria bacterium]|jgi:phosphoglycerate dehydrogenase-like enzyme